MKKLIFAILLLSSVNIKCTEAKPEVKPEKKEEQQSKTQIIDEWFNKYVKGLDFASQFVLLDSLFKQILFLFESNYNTSGELSDLFAQELEEVSKIPGLKEASEKLLELKNIDFYYAAFKKLANAIEMNYLINELEDKLNEIKLKYKKIEAAPY